MPLVEVSHIVDTLTQRFSVSPKMDVFTALYTKYLQTCLLIVSEVHVPTSTSEGVCVEEEVVISKVRESHQTEPEYNPSF